MNISKKKLDSITEDLTGYNRSFLASISYLDSHNNITEEKIEEEIIKANFLLGRMYGVLDLATLLGIYELGEKFEDIMRGSRSYISKTLGSSKVSNILLNDKNRFTALGMLYATIFANKI